MIKKKIVCHSIISQNIEKTHVRSQFWQSERSKRGEKAMSEGQEGQFGY